MRSYCIMLWHPSDASADADDDPDCNAGFHRYCRSSGSRYGYARNGTYLSRTPVDGIALVAGVDRIFDMGRTVVNITGDASCCIIVSNMERKKDAKREIENGL